MARANSRLPAQELFQHDIIPELDSTYNLGSMNFQWANGWIKKKLEIAGIFISKGITWTSRTSAADNDWLSVTYGNGLFVAVANSGTGNRVMTSPDGITWTSRTSAADNGWRSVTYGNGLFVAVANSGTGNRVMTSGKMEINTPPKNNIYQGGMILFGDLKLDTIIGSKMGTATSQKLGLWNVTPVIQPASAGQADQGAMTATNPPAGGTGATEGAYDTAANRNLMITSQTALVADVAALDVLLTEIRTALVNVGIMKGSA